MRLAVEDKPLPVPSRESCMTEYYSAISACSAAAARALAAARTAARLGAKVVIVEKRALGGAYLTQTFRCQAFCTAALQATNGAHGAKPALRPRAKSILSVSAPRCSPR